MKQIKGQSTAAYFGISNHDGVDHSCIRVACWKTGGQEGCGIV